MSQNEDKQQPVNGQKQQPVNGQKKPQKNFLITVEALLIGAILFFIIARWADFLGIGIDFLIFQDDQEMRNNLIRTMTRALGLTIIGLVLVYYFYKQTKDHVN